MVGSVVVLLLAAVLLVTPTTGLVGARSPTAAASSTIDVTGTSSLTFDPNTFEMIATNSSITVHFTDGSDEAHTFSILKREGVVIPNPQSVSSGQLLGLFNSYGSLVNLTVSSSGTTSTANFTSPSTGWYEFMCLEPGHFQSGMYGFIAFGEALPSNLSVSAGDTGPGTAVFIIIGTIVSLVVICIVLGFVVGRRRGSEFEMPPERLGYSEPPTPGGEEPALPPGGPPPPPAA